MTSQIKPLGGLERVKLAEAVPLDTPFTLYIFPTTFCNFKCVYCAHSQPTSELMEQYGFSKENMSLETLDNIIVQLKEFPKKLKVISLTGHGEPMLHKDLPEMIRRVKYANVAERIEIISNGSLLTNKLADEIIDAGLDILRISLQGLNSDKYLSVCGYKLDFEEYTNNLAYYYNNKRTGQQLFVKIIDVALEKNQEQTFYNTFENISDRMYIEFVQKVYSGVELTKNMEFHSTNRYGDTYPIQQVCPMSFFTLGIYPNGDMIPCDVIYKPVILGNVNQERILDMWNGDKLYEFRMNQLKNGRFTNPECARCVTPDDILRPEDILDNNKENIIIRMEAEYDKRNRF